MIIKENNNSPYEIVFDSLEEAIRCMMEQKRKEPREVMSLKPSDDDLASEWDEKGWYVTTVLFATDAPHIVLSECNETICGGEVEELLPGLEDEEAYVADIANKIRESYGVSGSEGWMLEDFDVESLVDDTF